MAMYSVFVYFSQISRDFTAPFEPSLHIDNIDVIAMSSPCRCDNGIFGFSKSFIMKEDGREDWRNLSAWLLGVKLFDDMAPLKLWDILLNSSRYRAWAMILATLFMSFMPGRILREFIVGLLLRSCDPKSLFLLNSDLPWSRLRYSDSTAFIEIGLELEFEFMVDLVLFI